MTLKCTQNRQRIKKSGGALRKKVTVYIDGHAKPQWFVAMPLGHQPMGGMSGICVTSVGAVNANGSTASCDAKEHVAVSGVSMQVWEGGNMPQTEEIVYKYKQSKSGFTMLAFTILTFAVSWGIASAMSAAVGTAGAAGATLSPVAIGSISAGVYAGVGTLSGVGLTDVQSGWMGSSGNGVLVPKKTGVSDHQKRLNKGLENVHIKSRVGVGLKGVKSLYSGNCPENMTVSACSAAGLDAGTMHRPDSFSETNTTLILAAQKDKCKALIPPAQIVAAETDPALKESLRKWVQQCASPQNGSWDTGW